jgi:hypothetical protein
MTCLEDGTDYGPCQDEQTPVDEVCDNLADDDCDGDTDETADMDGDGWTPCDGDCCDVAADCTVAPELVNPGALEILDNGVDDDCDPLTSDTVPPDECSTAQDFDVTADDMAYAIELCQFTTADPPLDEKKWGVISAEFRTPEGDVPASAQLDTMQQSQAAVMINYGNVIVPQVGSTLAGISNGWMRDEGDPGWTGNPSSSMGYFQQPPADYLAEHGGNLPSSSSCMGTCPAGSGANDGVNLRLEIRVPTNADELSFQMRFFSYEYWNYSCTSYNDFFLALLTSGESSIPADKNIAYDSLNNPISVNNGFVEVCNPHWMYACLDCPSGNAELAGTGMCSSFPTTCHGAGTNWLQITSPVVPGETIVLELMVFDVSDGILDSLSLLDAFSWTTI